MGTFRQPKGQRQDAGTTRPAEPGQEARRTSTTADLLWPAGILLAAFVVRLVHVVQSRAVVFFDYPVVDGRAYLEWGQRIAAGDWLGSEVFYQAPLYPYFLALAQLLAGADLFWIRIIQIAVGAGSCGLMFLAGKAFFSRRVGIAAGLILALYPPAIFFDALLQKSVLDLLWTTLLLWLLGRARRRTSVLELGGAGLVLGLLCLTRENALLLIPVLGAWLAIHVTKPGLATRAGRVGVFAVGLLIALLPVGFRNWAVGGEFALTTSQAGPNFYIGNNPDAPGIYVPLRPGRGGPRTERQDAAELAELARGHPLTPREVSHYWLGKSWEFIRAQPGAWLRLTGRKAIFTFNAYEIPDAEDMYFYELRCGLIRSLGYLLHFGVLFPLAVAGIYLTMSRWRELWVLYALVLTMAVSVIAFFVFARYRFPLVPVLTLFAGAALVEGYAAVRARHFTRIAVAAVAILVAAGASNWPPPLLKRHSQLAVSHTNAGDALYENGHYERALSEYQAAVEIEPRFMGGYVGLAKTRARLGRLKAAYAAYEEAGRRAPTAFQVELEFGTALGEAGARSQAVKHLRRALSLLPPDASVRAEIEERLRQYESSEIDSFEP
ncbi:MAG: tetratricopeptide repeat protein [Phycisphaerae bacterium]|nr:tetratricopeptide repeat protein [Phycisphaerae bacterium]